MDKGGRKSVRQLGKHRIDYRKLDTQGKMAAKEEVEIVTGVSEEDTEMVDENIDGKGDTDKKQVGGKSTDEDTEGSSEDDGEMDAEIERLRQEVAKQKRLLREKKDKEKEQLEKTLASLTGKISKMAVSDRQQTKEPKRSGRPEKASRPSHTRVRELLRLERDMASDRRRNQTKKGERDRDTSREERGRWRRERERRDERREERRDRRRPRQQREERTSNRGNRHVSYSASSSSTRSTSVSSTSSWQSSSSRSLSRERRRKGKSSVKSGIKAKAEDRVKYPQVWPHSALQGGEFVNKSIKFQDLDFRALVAGEMEICLSGTTGESERNGRMRLLRHLSYMYSPHKWSVLSAVYSTVVRKIELGELTWGSDFTTQIQYAVSLATSSRQETKQGKIQTKPTYRKTGKTEVYFCAEFQRSTCDEEDGHMGKVNGRDVKVRHICGRCWMRRSIKSEHGEHTDLCPLKTQGYRQ